MYGKDVAKKIEENLLNAAKRYFQENLPGTSFPDQTKDLLQITLGSVHGDMASNIAMRLAKQARRPAPEVGENIIRIFRGLIEKAHLSVFVAEIKLKGAFINFWLSEEYYRKLLTDIRQLKDDFGKSTEGHGEHINLEYVSANPTGPLTIAHGRQAAIGDALSRIMRFNGYKVTNEYYLNDIGRQITILGRSVEVRYLNLFGNDVPLPEDSYLGDYVIDIAKEIRTEKGDIFLAEIDPDGHSPKSVTKFFREYAVSYIMKLIERDLADFGVSFDVWTSQGAIEERKEVESVLDILEKAGYIFESEGAKWFASTRFGDDKDRVVVKSDGSYTYLAPDIAYHLNKYRRNFSCLIDFLGPDHHGYIKRMKAAVQALGHSAKSLKIMIVQLVTLTRGGKAVSMSTRKGEFISLREIIDEIGKDVSRFFFLSRRLDSHLDFDIELAKKESSDNPVFYIQYAHARICSIKGFSRKGSFRRFFRKVNLELLTDDKEKQLMRKLSEFPFAVKASADSLEPNRIIIYLSELARCFHSFYTGCRVVTEDGVLSKSRLYLVECVRIVLANGLNLLNITLPEKM